MQNMSKTFENISLYSSQGNIQQKNYGFSAILLFQISSNRMPKLSHINNAVHQVKPHVIGIKFPKRTPWTPQSKFEIITTNVEIRLH